MTRAEQIRFLRQLGILPPEVTEQSDADPQAPSFDGGVRQTPPLPSDHNQTVLEIVQNWKSGQGGW